MGWNEGGRKYLRLKAEAPISEEVVDSEPIFEWENRENFRKSKHDLQELSSTSIVGDKYQL